MNGLLLFFFAELATVAIVVPASTVPGRWLLPKLGRVFIALLLVLLPLLGAVSLWLPNQGLLGVIHLQLMVIGFALGVAGVAALAGRFAQWGGPAAVTIVALLVLATPFWGDVVFNIDSEPVSEFSRSALVVANPLFVVAARLDSYDWLHGNVLYGTYRGVKLTRLGEDFPDAPASLWRITVGYAALGLVAAGIAGLVQPRRRPPESDPRPETTAHRRSDESGLSAGQRSGHCRATLL